MFRSQRCLASVAGLSRSAPKTPEKSQSIAVITGGSRGIGLEIARSFLAAQRWGRIVLVSRNSENLEEARYSLLNNERLTGHIAHDEMRDRVVTLQANLADISEVEDLGKHINALGDVDILVNSAGIVSDAVLAVQNSSRALELLNINLTATILTSRAVVKGMMKRKKGCILNIASAVGLRGNEGQSVYGASKAGVIGFTKSLARELGSRNIRVNAIAPGYIETDMIAGMSERKRQEILSSTPLGRFGKPEEIAQAAMFLATAEYITGECLVVDGGLTA
ncbi:uncharacterized protein SPPG_01492 [Spizellomyces punctatus DAOM BR117]|uniref:Ketoreductase domain-containing protein n=1 Tax=Spizellomyces punctatus (strain DAOM BR117) TaxID=645134 RepID=A0A0L0HSJ4_SPIPD|nr:uncharacterized protein SPPG_01492 [Spizellomyces punctatus DAOM BR117]KND04047.1 hypothetical protein SPPG_01492 [Spizellomyces punctatus DAOM BR117]|eukprot:XP_016612086.1 hypothetical protein SPPG_01492 [Spizellomyces punctatus DAOM BR117]